MRGRTLSHDGRDSREGSASRQHLLPSHPIDLKAERGGESKSLLFALRAWNSARIPAFMKPESHLSEPRHLQLARNARNNEKFAKLTLLQISYASLIPDRREGTSAVANVDWDVKSMCMCLLTVGQSRHIAKSEWLAHLHEHIPTNSSWGYAGRPASEHRTTQAG